MLYLPTAGAVVTLGVAEAPAPGPDEQHLQAGGGRDCFIPIHISMGIGLEKGTRRGREEVNKGRAGGGVWGD